MPKVITERIIDYPESAAGRASPYSAGGTSTAATLVDHVHNSGLNQGGELALYGLVASPLSQFAATTSAQLAGVLSDETGVSGGFLRSPAIVTNRYLAGDAAGTATEWDIAFTAHEILTGQSYIVPDGHHYNVAHPYLLIEGDLDVIGDVVIHNPGGRADSVVTVVTSYTANIADDYVIVNNITADVTITLPLASSATKAIEIIRADATSYTVTVVGTSSQTINGETSQPLRQYDALKAVPVSTYWLIG